MRRDLAAFRDLTFDVAIVGGGISGACLAHDATLRGLTVALLERGDFGGATSAASSKLLHGGIRYLQQARLDKVRESARERAHFQRIAPHLTRWVPFLVPTYRGMARGRLVLACGTRLYNLLSRPGNDLIRDPAKQVPRGPFYDRAALAQRAPDVAARPDVTGAQVLYESHLHSTERMTLAFVKSAVRQGAAAANHACVDGVLRAAGRVCGVAATDVLTGQQFEVKARIVANAAGPWLPDLNDSLQIGALHRPITGFSTGVHIVTRQIMESFAVALPTARRSGALLDRGGRHVFAIPWRGHSLIGTSDRLYAGPLDAVAPTEEDVAHLLTDVGAALPGVALARRDVVHAFAGLYPLTTRELHPDVYQGTSDFQVIDHARHGGSDRVVSVLGAKYTTARRLAELATTMICKKLDRGDAPCRTAQTPVIGGDIDDVATFTSDAIVRHAPLLDPRTVEHLVHHYGTEIDAVVKVAADDRRLLRRVCPTRESIEAEVLFAVDQEMALTLRDVILRRTGLGTIGNPGEACLRRCAEIMGPRLGWTASRLDDEVRRTLTRFVISGQQTDPGHT